MKRILIILEIIWVILFLFFWFKFTTDHKIDYFLNVVRIMFGCLLIFGLLNLNKLSNKQ